MDSRVNVYYSGILDAIHLVPVGFLYPSIKTGGGFSFYGDFLDIFMQL